MRGDGHREREERQGFGRRALTLVEDLDILLDQLCRHWGFCNYLTGEELVRSAQPLTADDFARAVLPAEGFPHPDLELEWHRKFKRLFIDRYGKAVSASDYAVG